MLFAIRSKALDDAWPLDMSLLKTMVLHGLFELGKLLFRKALRGYLMKHQTWLQAWPLG